MEPLTVLLLRHAEKPAPDEGLGVDERGRPDAACLAVRGWQRSGALTHLLSSRAEHRPLPKAVFASTALKKSRRCEQTVAALSAKLSLAMNTSFGKGEEMELVEGLLTSTGTIVVCWQHEALPAIARRILGSDMPTGLPTDWPESRFDMVWKLERCDRHWTFAQVPQLLLAGDSDKAIE